MNKRICAAIALDSKLTLLETQITQRSRNVKLGSLLIFTLYIIVDFLAAVEFVVASRKDVSDSARDNRLLLKIATYDLTWFTAFFVYAVVGRETPALARLVHGPMEIFLITHDWAQCLSLFWAYRWLVITRIVALNVFQHIYCMYILRRQILAQQEHHTTSAALEKLSRNDKLRRRFKLVASRSQAAGASVEPCRDYSFTSWMNRNLDKFMVQK